MPVFSITFRNRWLALLVGIVVLGAGAALLVVGLALLAAVALAGGVLGLAIVGYRKLRGIPAHPLRTPSHSGLDPSLEVFPEHETLPPDETPRPTPNEDPRWLPRQ
ncbi:MAG TPA: hypothetical protein VFZ21_10860 [Gemmatimonadaceae bacterium]|jgi:hypothetical protein|nr:hypothetical protein [Gemmatimonadaceae bacterium]